MRLRIPAQCISPNSSNKRKYGPEQKRRIQEEEDRTYNTYSSKLTTSGGLKMR